MRRLLSLYFLSLSLPMNCMLFLKCTVSVWTATLFRTRGTLDLFHWSFSSLFSFFSLLSSSSPLNPLVANARLLLRCIIFLARVSLACLVHHSKFSSLLLFLFECSHFLVHPFLSVLLNVTRAHTFAHFHHLFVHTQVKCLTMFMIQRGHKIFCSV